jgi:NNP family nitrate/nitrite transporter-like MFS transporter
MVSGIVGAGGNVGGMLFGFLFKSESITYVQAFQYIGYIVIGVSIIILITKYALSTKTKELLDSNSIEGTLQVV